MNTAYTQEQVATIKAAAIEANAEDDPSLFQGCLIDLMEGLGASEDHVLVKAHLAKLPLSPVAVNLVHAVLVNSIKSITAQADSQAAPAQLLSPTEQKWVLQSPAAIAQLLTFIDLDHSQAVSVLGAEEWGTWPPKRHTELKEIGRKIIEQDPECFDADTLQAFGFPAPTQPAAENAWQPMTTAPTNEMILLTVEDASGERRVFPAEASIEDGNLRWIITTGWVGWKRLQSAWTPVLWQRWLEAPVKDAKREGGAQ